MKIQHAIALLLSLLLLGCMTDSEDGKSSPLSLGTYEHTDTEFWTEEEDGVDATVTVRGQLELKSDGTYLLRVYVTSDDLELTNELVYEQKGSFSQSGSTVNLSSILERGSSSDPWVVPEEGSADSFKIRNVTSTTFQEYDDDEMRWVTWSKL